jgi:hypothetical protein
LSDDELHKIIAAAAFGLATFPLQNALLTTLVAKGHLTMKEAALTVTGAIIELDSHHQGRFASDLGSLARSILTTLEQVWVSQARQQRRRRRDRE